ncbi:MAG: DUF1800 family protein [Verrucomicrobia bacterium]|nr:DUF1800 family protein [Verrucomicrobiota bacterium]
MHKPKIRTFSLAAPCLAGGILLSSVLAQNTPPAVTEVTVKDGKKTIKFKPHPGADKYEVQSSATVSGPFQDDASGSLSGTAWTSPLTTPIGFYRLKVTEVPPNQLLSAVILNRLGYGPSPEDLDRIRSIGPQAYLAEQLAPETITESLPFDEVRIDNGQGGWQYVTVTGTGSSSKLYLYLNTAGEAHIDDIKLVAGTVAGAGQNLIRNGDFESPLTAADWAIAPNHANSAIVTGVSKSGNASLKVVASAGGSTENSAITQSGITPSLNANSRYTLSYWILPSTSKLSSITVRLSQNGIVSTPLPLPTLGTRLELGGASLNDLRQWHVQRAVRSRRQLLEVLLQFWENHFVTEHGKSADYLDRYYSSSQADYMNQLAAQFEYRENKKWRLVLLRPNGTFHELLKISAESPAMIIFLDTVDSKGNGSNIANENYARELLELFTFGVDNGYDQDDIVETSKAWTGWGVDIVDQPDNPFQTRTTNRPAGTANSVSNLIGHWTFVYKPGNHNNRQKVIFPGKTVPERFGPPYAGRPYELRLPVRTGTTNGGTNGIKDGYEIMAHLADLPFTQEFISVKLCRLFVHDDFETGYDFTDPNLSPEGKLVRRCMEAWENGSPKGQIRQVLSVIFNSDLFRTQSGSAQKVKTPLEFTVSAVRALSAVDANGAYTATTDGNFTSALNRMGAMQLFDRAEPDGFPEAGPPWISAGILGERLRWAQAFLLTPAQRSAAGINDVGSGTSCDPVALLRRKLPSSSLGDASAVANYFIDELYSAEGKANLETYGSIAVNFLNTADNGTTASLFSSLAVGSANYDTRVRGMVAMLLTLPRFQEQ